jgi:transcription termination/antitermination protein NusG
LRFLFNDGRVTTTWVGTPSSSDVQVSARLLKTSRFETLRANLEGAVKPEQHPWFAIRVKPNYEKPVLATLRGKGFEPYLPVLRTRRQWSDRVKVMDLPLFPGYLFCRLDLQDRMPLVTTPGFLYIVGVGKNPEPVDDNEIEAIATVLRSGLPVKAHTSLKVGQRIELQRGPLRGLQGILTKIADQHRLYVAVTLLQRSISVEVEPDWVKPVNASGANALNDAGRLETQATKVPPKASRV